MAFIMRNESFVCENCGKTVEPHPTGSARNHCPFCLCSKHVDQDFPGDRASSCGGLMRAIDFTEKKHKGTVIVHLCQICGKEITNIPAPDDDLVGLALRIPEERLRRQKGRKAYQENPFL